MTKEIVAWQPTGEDLDSTVSSRVLDRIAASVPDTTRRAYAGDWKKFVSWCAATGRLSMPATPETLAEYSSFMADSGKAPASIMRALSSIRVIHDLGGHVPPSVLAARAVIKSYRQERALEGKLNRTSATPLSARHLKEVSAALDSRGLSMFRDRVVFVLGWAMMARRSELAALNIEDVVEVESGLDVNVRKAKADQMADGRIVGVPYGSDPITCPVRLTRAWVAVLAERGITSGALLRPIDRHGHIAGEPGTALAGKVQEGGRLTGHGIGLIVKRAGRAAGIPLAGLKAHSLRAGGATGAYTGGADLLSIGRHGGWHDGSSALLGYIRDVDRWKKNPMHGAGL
jgi:site-specific recombinase XerD